jgi:hypothetical protein
MTEQADLEVAVWDSTEKASQSLDKETICPDTDIRHFPESVQQYQDMT